MNTYLTEFSHKEIKRDITSVSDSFARYASIGYNVSFTIRTQRFTFSGECELLRFPLTDQQIEQYLIDALTEDFRETNNIIGIFTKIAE